MSDNQTTDLMRKALEVLPPESKFRAEMNAAIWVIDMRLKANHYENGKSTDE